MDIVQQPILNPDIKENRKNFIDNYACDHNVNGAFLKLAAFEMDSIMPFIENHLEREEFYDQVVTQDITDEPNMSFPILRKHDILKSISLLVYVDETKDYTIESLFESIEIYDADNKFQSVYECLTSQFINTLNTIEGNSKYISRCGNKDRILIKIPFFFSHDYNTTISTLYDNKFATGVYNDFLSSTTVNNIKKIFMSSVPLCCITSTKLRCRIRNVSDDVKYIKAVFTGGITTNFIRSMLSVPNREFYYLSWINSKTKTNQEWMSHELRNTHAHVDKIIVTRVNDKGLLLPIDKLIMQAGMSSIFRSEGDYLLKKHKMSDNIYIIDFGSFLNFKQIGDLSLFISYKNEELLENTFNIYIRIIKPISSDFKISF